MEGGAEAIGGEVGRGAAALHLQGFIEVRAVKILRTERPGGGGLGEQIVAVVENLVKEPERTRHFNRLGGTIWDASALSMERLRSFLCQIK